MKNLKRFLIMPFVLFSMLLVGCQDNPTEPEKPIVNKLSVDVSEIKALPNTTFEIHLSNPLNELVAFDVSDYGILNVVKSKSDTYVLSFLKEGLGYVTFVSEHSEEIKCNVEVIDLAITNEDDFIEINTTKQITLNKSVNATYAVSGEGASITNDGKLTVTKYGEFEVSVTYGQITLKKVFDSNPRSNTIDILSRRSPYIYFYGRDVIENGKVIMNNVGSGFEVTFKGTMLKATFEAPFGSYYGKTKISVLVDEEKDTTKRIITLENPNKSEYVLVDGLTNEVHTIRVLKRTEALATSLFLYGVTTDGYFKVNTHEEKLKIEAYGDSITAGYGNLRGDLSDTTSAEYQSGLQTYATYAASMLDAEINVQARSGLGLYTSSGIDDNEQLNSFYKCVNYDGKYEWNFTNFTPDLIFINIGTNDYWNNTVFNEEIFINEYIKFVSNLASIYGDDVSFILMSGLMEVNVIKSLPTIKTQLLQKISNSIHILTFEKCVEGHPVVEEHLKAGTSLANYIKDNGLNVIHHHDSKDKEYSEPKGELVDLELTLTTYDPIPSFGNMFVKGLLEEEVMLDRVDSFTFKKSISIKEGDYNISTYINEESYPNYSSDILHVRKDNASIEIKLDTFIALPENTYDDTFGWFMSDHLFEASFTANSENEVVYYNPSNWKAAMVLNNNSLKDDYALEAKISTENITANSYLGLVPYYIDDLNFITVYLQFDANLKCRGVGSTGLIAGEDIGFTDYNEFFNMDIDLKEGVILKVARNKTHLTVTLGDITVTKTYFRMNQDNCSHGLYSSNNDEVIYSNISFKEHYNSNIEKWSQSSCLFEQSLSIISDDSVRLSNYNNWLAGFGLIACEYDDDYTISTTMTAAEDGYLESQDVQVALVPYYADDNNLVVVYLQWNATGQIKSLGVTGFANGEWLGWNDMWTFENSVSTLKSGDELQITRKGHLFTATYKGISETKAINSFKGKPNYAVGVWCHNADVTFSDFTLTKAI